jgi:hypothetical protein
MLHKVVRRCSILCKAVPDVFMTIDGCAMLFKAVHSMQIVQSMQIVTLHKDCNTPCRLCTPCRENEQKIDR